MSILEKPKKSIAEVADVVGKHQSTVWRWINRGVKGRKLTPTFIGGQTYVLDSDLETFLASGRRSDPQEQEPESEYTERAEEVGKELEKIGI